MRRSLLALVLASALMASCRQPSDVVAGEPERADAAAVDVLAGSETTSDLLENCARTCATTEPLHCPVPPPPGDACAIGCATSGETIPECRASFAALLRCLAPRPISDWYCDAEGKATYRNDVCAAERAAAAQCLGR